MNNTFKVSVVIPVYNAAAYVSQAVESALEQSETAEVLLVEDGSPDNALEICESLAGKYDKVRLLRHPNGENRGAGASRNLGMQAAQEDYIAFLDADDFYLPGRFAQTKKVFLAEPACEGVYEAIGMHIEDDEGWERWQASGKPEERIKTVKEPIDPQELGVELILGEKGHFSLDGLTIKKTILDKSGYMDGGLRIHQDTNFIIRAALAAKLLPGSIVEPVTMWRVHKANRVSSLKTRSEKLQDRMKFLYATYSWTRKKSETKARDLLVKLMFGQLTSIDEDELQNTSKIRRIAKRFTQLSKWIYRHNEFLAEPQFWKSLFLFVISGGSRL